MYNYNGEDWVIRRRKGGYRNGDMIEMPGKKTGKRVWYMFAKVSGDEALVQERVNRDGTPYDREDSELSDPSSEGTTSDPGHQASSSSACEQDQDADSKHVPPDPNPKRHGMFSCYICFVYIPGHLLIILYVLGVLPRPEDTKGNPGVASTTLDPATDDGPPVAPDPKAQLQRNKKRVAQIRQSARAARRRTT